jgi:hypothetical protein
VVLSGTTPTCHRSPTKACLAQCMPKGAPNEGLRTLYTGDRYDNCSKCRKKTRWVRCPNCNGRGPTWTTTCRLRCHGGYKCEHGSSDPYHAPA